jgi:peptidoglycan/LPS O-acetylase OafA/YrhL
LADDDPRPSEGAALTATNTDRSSRRARPSDGGFALSRKPGLDGLRALAVVAVIVYHLNAAWLPGGFFGVDVFFVVSGYLITSLLLREHLRDGTVDLRRFWARRARRLLPSVVVLVVVVVLIATATARDALPALRLDVLFSLLYVVNWWLIVHRVSYFAAIGRPPLLLHLWSLAIEEQFYLLWPPVLLFLLRRFRFRVILGLTLAGAAASSVWMGVLFHPGVDPSRAYFGTDTHAQGLLIGCALAIAVPPWAPRVGIKAPARRMLCGTGAVAAAGLLVLLVTLGHSSSFAYPTGFVLVDCCTAILIVLVVHPSITVGPALGHPVVRWIGTRSYALYLWHWPILQLTRPDQDLDLSGWPLLLLRLALVAAAGELSYRFVEVPFRDPETWTLLRARLATGASRYLWAGSSAALVAVIAVLLVAVPAPLSPIRQLADGATPAARETLPPAVDQRFGPPPSPGAPPTAAVPSTAAQTPAPSTPAPSTAAPSTEAAPPAPAPPAVPTAAQLAPQEPILAIGDSVMLAAAPGLTSVFGPGITVDAEVGRQVDAGIARLQQYRASGALAGFRTVVVGLGTNGALTSELFDQFVTVLAGVPKVVFVDSYADRSWVATTNATLAQLVPQHPGWVEDPWTTVAPGPGLLYPDGIHPTPTGATAYADLLATTLG